MKVPLPGGTSPLILFSDDMKNNESSPIAKGFGIAEMRDWDMILLGRYRPCYHAVSRTCTLCALSPCDLDKGRRGACGQDLETFLAREALILAVTGAAAHAAHARDVVERLITDRGGDFVLDLGDRVQIRMPITQIVAATNPGRLDDLMPVLEYIDTQLVRLLAATHFGGESALPDIESKTMHAGTMDLLSMEVAETAQIAGHGFPRGSGELPLIPLGVAHISDQKPLILCIGHNSDVAQRIIDKLDASGREGSVDVAGLCCTAHEMVRYGARGRDEDREGLDPDMSSGPIIVGNLRDQLRFIQSGRADVIVVDQQCIRPDLLPEAMHTAAFFIATSDLNCGGMPDDAGMDPERLASDLVHRPKRAVFISDPDKAASLSVVLAERYGRVASPSKQVLPVPSESAPGNPVDFDTSEKKDEIFPEAARCNGCGLCTKHCPLTLSVAKMIFTLGQPCHKAEDAPDPRELHKRCLACGRCSAACPQGVPVMEILETFGPPCHEGARMRVGKGPIDDYEIKSTGPSIVLGDIPGVVAFLTCPGYQDSRDSVSWMARRLAERGYIVLAAGCAAIDIGLGDSRIYGDFPGVFETGGVINLGSCVSSANAIGALIKVASIFLHRRLDGNFAEIADYILNRIGTVGMLWGGITPKSFSASAGANRLGVPVIFGPQGYRFRRTLEGSAKKHPVFDARSGQKVLASLAPAHLCTVSATKEEAIVAAARLCIRPNDTTWGRQTKLRNYIEMCEAHLGETPCDVADWVRVADDLPEERKEELLRMLDKSGWEPSFIPDPTLLENLVRPAQREECGRDDE